jgi:hypothetical protein
MFEPTRFGVGFLPRLPDDQAMPPHECAALGPSLAVITPTVRTSSVATLTAIACVALGLLIVPARATAITWIPPVDLSTPSEFSAWEPRPEIAISGGGGGVAIWPQLQGLGTLEAASMSLTGTWGPPVKLAPNEWGQREEPQLAMNEAGEAVAVWKHFGEQGTVVAKVRTPLGEWGAQETLSPEGSLYGPPDVAVGPAGEAVAVWSQIPRFGSSSKYRIESSFRPAGGHWEPAVTLSDPEHQSYSPQVAIAPTGRIVAAFYGYLDSPETHPTVQVAEKQGGSWSAPQALSGASNAAFPKVAASTAGTTVIWHSREVEGEERWIEAASRTTGGEWGHPVELSEPESFGPQIGVDAAGTAVAIWNSSYGEDGDYIESSTLPVGGHWSEPTTISGRVSGRARLAVAPNGQTLAAWSVWREPEPYVGESFVEGASGRKGEWGEPTTLSQAGAWAVRPAVALDGEGDGAVAWWAANPTLPQATEFVRPRPTASIAPAPAPAPTSTSTAPAPAPSRTVRRGTAFAAHLARVKRGRVLLRLRCRGGRRCRGTIKLLIGHKLIGKTRFRIATGKAKVIRVKLNHKGRKLLRKTHRHRLKLKLRGRAVRHRVIVVKQLRHRR